MKHFWKSYTKCWGERSDSAPTERHKNSAINLLRKARPSPSRNALIWDGALQADQIWPILHTGRTNKRSVTISVNQECKNTCLVQWLSTFKKSKHSLENADSSLVLISWLWKSTRAKTLESLQQVRIILMLWILIWNLWLRVKGVVGTTYRVSRKANVGFGENLLVISCSQMQCRLVSGNHPGSFQAVQLRQVVKKN